MRKHSWMTRWALIVSTLSTVSPLAPIPAQAAASQPGVARDPLTFRAYQLWKDGEVEAVVKLVQPQAERGNPVAQYLMGQLHSRGEGVPQDEGLAVQWYRKAAQQGLPEAENELGTALAEGRGVEADLRQAAEWYRRAAEQGLASAQANLGRMYGGGIGVRRNESTAAEWFTKAAEQGLGWAQIYLADAYVYGRGVRADADRAMEWYRKAADQDYPEAQYTLGALDARDRPVTTYWLARAARLGHEKAARDLPSVLSRLPRTRLLKAVELRERADDSSRVIRTAQPGDYLYELGRSPEWLQVYIKDGHSIGFVSVEQLQTGD